MKAKGHGMIWDAETDSVLVRFVGGEAEVNGTVARKLKALGYELDGDVPAEAETEVAEAEPEAAEVETEVEPTDEAKSRRRK